MPLSLQVVVYRKIFRFDRALPPSAIRITVVYAGPDRNRASAVMEAFKATGISADLSLTSELGPQLSSVLYVLPGVDIAAVRKFCSAHRALSIGPQPGMVRQGAVSLALEAGAGGHVEIWVNLSRLKDEQHELDSGLLQLTKVVQ